MSYNYSFQWDTNGNDLLMCNYKSIERIMDSEDAAIIYNECDILHEIDKFIQNNDLSDESKNKILDLKDIIKDKIEVDVLNYAIDSLL